MIEIIAGTFGYYDGRKVIPVTNADGPQTFDPELEERLVRKGIARYIDSPVVESSGDILEYHEDMKLDELKEVARGYGVDASHLRKKSDVIAAIEAVREENTGDSGQPPQIDVEEPV